MIDDASRPRSAGSDPFAPERLARLDYRLGAATWTGVLDDFEEADWEASVSGPRGSGKSVFLDGLAETLEAEGFVTWRVRLDPEVPDPIGRSLPRLGRSIQPDVVLLVDDADRLGIVGRWRLRRMARRTAGLVVACRDPFPGLPSLHVARPSPGVVEDLVAELLPWGPRPGRNALRRMFLAHGGNVREVLAECGRIAASARDEDRGADPGRGTPAPEERPDQSNRG